MKEYYKLFPVEEILKYLSVEQKENLYQSNLFLAVTKCKGFNDKEVLKGVLIAYDLNNKPYNQNVKKIIPELLLNSQKVVCLPKKINNKFPDKAEWIFGKSFERKKSDGTIEFKHRSYSYRTGRKLAGEVKTQLVAV